MQNHFTVRCCRCNSMYTKERRFIIHQHKCVAELVRKQEAREKHTRRTCDVIFYSRCQARSVQSKIRFSWCLMGLIFVYSTFKTSQSPLNQHPATPVTKRWQDKWCRECHVFDVAHPDWPATLLFKRVGGGGGIIRGLRLNERSIHAVWCRTLSVLNKKC